MEKFFSYPLVFAFSLSSSIVVSPPIPVPIIIDAFFISSFESLLSFNASLAAKMPKALTLSILLNSFFEKKSSRFISAWHANFTLEFLLSKSEISFKAFLPIFKFFVSLSMVFPKGDIKPIPVTTTLFIIILHQLQFLVHEYKSNLHLLKNMQDLQHLLLLPIFLLKFYLHIYLLSPVSSDFL